MERKPSYTPPITWSSYFLVSHQPSNVNYTSAPLTAGPMLPHWEERWYPELNLEEIFRTRWGTLPSFFCLSFEFVHFWFSDEPHFDRSKISWFCPPPPSPSHLYHYDVSNSVSYLLYLLLYPLRRYDFRPLISAPDKCILSYFWWNSPFQDNHNSTISPRINPFKIYQ